MLSKGLADGFYIPKKRLLFLLSLPIILLGCARGCGGVPQKIVQEQNEILISGIVKNSEDETPVESAIVSVKVDLNNNGFFEPEETFIDTTRKNGFFAVRIPIIDKPASEKTITEKVITTRIITGRVLISVSKEGYAHNSFNTDVGNFAGEIKISPAKTAVDEDVSDGIQFTLTRQRNSLAPKLYGGKNAVMKRITAKSESEEILATVDISPADVPKGVQRVSGEATYIDPISNPELMPGGFAARLQEGIITLSSAGVVSAEIYDQNGNPIKAKAKVKVAVPESAYHTLYDYVEETTDKVEVPFWHFNEFDGTWRQSDKLGILVDENGQVITPVRLAKIVTGKEKPKLYTETEVSHFSAWNVDYPVDTHASVMGRIVDSEGNGIPGLHIQTMGNTYGGLGDWKGTYTDSNGVFGVDVKRSESQQPQRTSIPFENDCVWEVNPDTVKKMCPEILDSWWNTLNRDFESIKRAFEQSYKNKWIDQATYDLAKVHLDRARESLERADFKGAKDSINKAINTIGWSGRAADQIFWERLATLQDEATNFLKDQIIGTLQGLALQTIPGSNCYGKISQSTLNFIIENIKLLFNEQLAKSLDEGAIIGTAQITLAQLQNLASTLADEDLIKCFEDITAKLEGGISIGPFEWNNKLKVSKSAGPIFVAQTAALFLDQIMQSWLERGEWKQAKAYETVVDSVNSYMQSVGATLRKIKEAGVDVGQCAELLYSTRSCRQGGGSPAPHFTAPTSPSLPSRTPLKPKSTNPEEVATVLQSIIVEFLKISYNILDVKLKFMNLSGGAEFYSNWAMPSTSANTSFSKVSPPDINRGGAERSRILINGRSIDELPVTTTVSNTGIDWNNFGSPILGSTRHEELYRSSDLIKNPSRWIGELVLNIKTSKVSGRLMCGGGGKIPCSNLPLVIKGQLSSVPTTTNEKGEFEVSIPPGKVCLHSHFITVKCFEIKGDTNLGDIVISKNLQPRINSLSIPTQASIGETISLEVSASDPDNYPSPLSFEWILQICGPSSCRTKSIGKAPKISFTPTAGGWNYISVCVSDGMDSVCSYKNMKVLSTTPPKIISVQYPEEITEYERAKIEVQVQSQDGSDLFYYFYLKEAPGQIHYLDSSSQAVYDPVYWRPITEDVVAKIRVRVVDSSWRSDEREIRIRVKNIISEPKVSIFADRVSSSTLPFTVNFCTEGENILDQYEWDFDGDGTYDFSSSYRCASFTYTKYGRFKVKVRAPGIEKGDAEDSLEVSVFSPPSVSLYADKLTGTRPLVVNFEAKAYDPDGSIIRYIWDFDGDGSSDYQSTANTVSFTFPITSPARFYFPRVVVSDNDGLSALGVTSVQIVNLPPSVSLFADRTSGVVPITVNFVAQASDQDGSVSYYIWNFGDGTTSITYTDSTTYTYTLSGNFTAYVEAVDNEGGKARSNLITITISAQVGCDTPQVSLSLTPSSGTAPLDVTFTATAYSSFSIQEYRWDFKGDGTVDAISQSNTTSYTYQTGGQYYPKVWAVNSCGGVGYATATITVQSVHPLFSQKVSSVTTYTPSVSNDNGFFIADMNSDGKPDMILGSGEYAFILTYDSVSFGFSDSRQVFSSGEIINDIVADDFTGDGKLDAVFISVSGKVACYAGDGNGRFDSSTTWGISLTSNGIYCFPFSVTSADLNSDGKKDIILGCSGKPVILYGSGNCQFNYQNPVTLPILHGWQTKVIVKDMNGDGYLDIVGNERDLSYLWIVSGPSYSSAITFGNSIDFADIDVGDFDGDGKPEVVGISQSKYIYIFKNNYPNFPTSSSVYVDIPPTTPYYCGIVLGDLNSDAIPDATTICRSSGVTNMSAIALGKSNATFDNPYYYYSQTSHPFYPLADSNFSAIGRPHIFVVNLGNRKGVIFVFVNANNQVQIVILKTRESE